MDRRNFLQSGLSFSICSLIPGVGPACRLATAESAEPGENPNWATFDHGASARASSYAIDPPNIGGSYGYLPSKVFGDDIHAGWEADMQTAGAWIEIAFPNARLVSEVWILSQILPPDILGADVYNFDYARGQWFEAPRRIQLSFSDGTNEDAELLQTNCFQIITLPHSKQTSSVCITIKDVWPKPGGKESGIGKIRIFPRKHAVSFEIDAYKMYDVREGQPVQAATLSLINPEVELKACDLVVSRSGKILTRIPLQPIPSGAAIQQDVWIPALFEDAEMGFEVVSQAAQFCCKRKLLVPAYQPTYFDSGTFSLNCTCHNDLGWLDTQAKTADYRSAQIILPALKLLREYPEFQYSMESTTYLIEFLDRHPELRGDMITAMQGRRFTWGASYVQCQEVHVGSEKLVRQFYFGRLWLKKTFPGVDTHFYVQTDPPSMTLQMPQILAKAGVKYCLQGRMPYGFYNWQAPDGSVVLTYGYPYPSLELDPKDNHGWLSCAEKREEYYSQHELPRMFIYDYTTDYLPPQPGLPPYVREQNDAMEKFAAIWNKRFSSDPRRQVHPPKMLFTTPEAFLDEFTKYPLDVVTLTGDWPFAWAYYDEPSNREALLSGRIAHNQLLTAERIYAGLALNQGFHSYPARKFEDAWKADVWPDHGWGGRNGTQTDEVYHKSYAHSKMLSDQILSGVGSQMAIRVARTSEDQIPVVVFNPVSWERTDVVECQVNLSRGWNNLALRDDTGKEIAYEVLEKNPETEDTKFLFVAEAVPSVGYRTFYLTSSPTKPQRPSILTGNAMENDFLRVIFGSGGIKSLYDKKQRWEVLRTDKFDGGEILQFSAPGHAWDDFVNVTTEDFDRTANHDFPFQRFEKNSVRTTAVREAQLKNFTLRQSFHLYEQLNRLDMDVEIVNWDGARSRELRVVFPINLDEARLSYEVPFGTVEIGKNELDFSMLPSSKGTGFQPQFYGGEHALAFREAINWIDASSPNYLSSGCLAASNTTVHLFRDETDNPVTYPMLQHVLLSTRKSWGWHPEFWFTQAGDHRYRMSLMPHHGDWRLRYREAIGFNYSLISFIGSTERHLKEVALPSTDNYLRLDPPNLILTTMKKSEGDDRIIIRFYEAEGEACRARIHMPKAIRQAWRTNLIEEDEEMLQPIDNGTLELAVGSWEIVTIKVSV
jgi:alpha-mannosidase